MKNLKTKKGFTLVELLIAMTIFIAFTGILIQSYTHIVRSQREANEYRLLYSEARTVFDTLVAELRDGMVDYGHSEQACGREFGFNAVEDEIWLVSKDAKRHTHIDFDGKRGKIRIGNEMEEYKDLNSDEVKVMDFDIYVSPYVDPYDSANFAEKSVRFHPKVTIFANFARGDYSVDFQTTISSRIYNQVYSYKCPGS